MYAPAIGAASPRSPTYTHIHMHTYIYTYTYAYIHIHIHLPSAQRRHAHVGTPAWPRAAGTPAAHGTGCGVQGTGGHTCGHTHPQLRYHEMRKDTLLQLEAVHLEDEMRSDVMRSDQIRSDILLQLEAALAHSTMHMYRTYVCYNIWACAHACGHAHVHMCTCVRACPCAHVQCV